MCTVLVWYDQRPDNLCIYLPRASSDVPWLRQDLSLGKLSCEPDEIYVPTVFALRDTTDLLPPSLEAQVRV